MEDREALWNHLWTFLIGAVGISSIEFVHHEFLFTNFIPSLLLKDLDNLIIDLEILNKTAKIVIEVIIGYITIRNIRRKKNEK